MLVVVVGVAHISPARVRLLLETARVATRSTLGNPKPDVPRTFNRQPTTVEETETMQMDDAELLEAVALQDQTAMAALFDKYSRLVYSIALRVLREPDLAEDVMQEVLLQVWRQPGGFVSQRGSLGAWLAVVARNRSIDVIRRRAHLTPLEDLVLPEPKNLQRAVEENHLMEQVRVAVDTLPKEQQAPLHMAYFEGLTHTEISERTGTPLGTVKTRIRTALTTVRRALEA
jgi:RNA polymerase sigma-70 factor, ECF subfamily